MNDFITGEQFIDIADFTFVPRNKIPGDCNPIDNTFDYKKLRDINIIYTHTFYAKQLFTLLELYTTKRFIVITHNADNNVDDSYKLPGCVVRWFAQNINTYHGRIESIPIGLENSKWFKYINKPEKMIRKLNHPKDYKNLVYMNHNIETNPDKRTEPYRLFRKKSWITVSEGKNGYKFDEYIDNIYNHYFTICPEGNGIDTHRIWETLYLGSHPIVIRNINNSFYTDLPICFINSWSDLSESFLLDWIKNNKKIKWNYDKLNFSYWKNKIMSWAI